MNRAEGQAARFAAIEAAYRQAPDVTRRRMYLETMQQILPQVGRKVFVAEGATGVLAAAVARQRRAGGDRGVGRHHTTDRRWPMSRSQRFMSVIGLVVLFLLGSSLYTVTEVNQAIITRFGQPVRDPVTEPGLHMKVPFIETANMFEKRFLEWGRVPEPGADAGQAVHLCRHLRAVAHHRSVAVLPAGHERAGRAGAARRHPRRRDAATRSRVTI